MDMARHVPGAEVQVQGPKLTTIALVDLPGFIQNENPEVDLRLLGGLQ